MYGVVSDGKMADPVGKEKVFPLLVPLYLFLGYGGVREKISMFGLFQNRVRAAAVLFCSSTSTFANPDWFDCIHSAEVVQL